MLLFFIFKFVLRLSKSYFNSPGKRLVTAIKDEDVVRHAAMAHDVYSVAAHALNMHLYY